MPNTIRRKSCRAILLTPDHEILLIKISNPDGSWTGWITPGGGIDTGEDEEMALRRELMEEVGLQKFTIGPRVWKRFHSFPWRDETIEQDEVFFLIKVPRFAAQTDNLQATEMLDINEVRWWKLDEIKKSTEHFAPDDLHTLLMDLLKNGPPPEIKDLDTQ